MLLDKLLSEAHEAGINVKSMRMPERMKGLYGDGCVWLNGNIPTRTEAACILSEELGHHHTSLGDILDQSKIENRKQERRAREWGYRRLVPLSRIIDAHRARVKGRHEIAEYLGVTDEFLQRSIDRYTDKYGTHVQVDPTHIILFDPLAVLELFPE